MKNPFIWFENKMLEKKWVNDFLEKHGSPPWWAAPLVSILSMILSISAMVLARR